MTIQRRVCFITGGANGLGKHLTLLLLERGWTVAVMDRDAAALAALPNNEHLRTYQADVCDCEQTRQTAALCAQDMGGIDLLIANAGIGMPTPATCFRAEDVDEMIRVNLQGVVHAIDAVLPGMIQRGRGHIVAISSLASYRGLPRMAGYSASKAGVNALMEALGVELGPLGIRISTVCPGWVRTGMTAGLRIPDRQTMEPRAAAESVLRAIERGRRFHAFPRGAVWRVRILRWLPRAISDWLLGRIMARRRSRRTRVGG